MSKGGLGDIDFRFAEPAEESKGEKYSLWATFYLVHTAQSKDDGLPLLDMQGREVGPKLTEKTSARPPSRGPYGWWTPREAHLSTTTSEEVRKFSATAHRTRLTSPTR